MPPRGENLEPQPLNQSKLLAPLGRSPWVLPLGLFCLLHLPFLGQAVHIDDANFLRLADGVLQDPTRPQDILINWLGTQERAFDVLSNPPGIAYLLALGGDTAQGTHRHHALLLPFTALAAWGGISLSRQLLRGNPLPGLLLMISPALVVSAHTLMPDLPLFGCFIAGLALFIKGVETQMPKKMAFGALLGGMGALFRYNGLLFFPIALLYGLVGARQRPSPKALFATLTLGLIPSLLWALQGALVYGIPHVLHMVAFQGGETGEAKGMMQLAAQVSFLGGTALLPFMGSLQGRLPLIAFGVGGVIGGTLSSSSLLAAGLGALFFGSGAALIVTAGVEASKGGPTRLFLILWLMAVLVFNQGLRFASVRYLLPALPPLLLLWGMGLRSRAIGHIALLGGATLSLCISIGDTLQASAYAGASEDILKVSPSQGLYVAGHWGLQHHLEGAGATSLDESGPPLPPESLIIVAHLPWPQALPPGQGPLDLLQERPLDTPWPLRTLSPSPGACWYSNSIATGSLDSDPFAQVGEATLLPYTIAWGPFDRLRQFQVPPEPAPQGPAHGSKPRRP